MFSRLQSLLSHSLRRFGIEKEVQTTVVLKEIEGVFCSYFGEGILEHVKLHSLQGGLLVVSVASSVVAQELRLKEKELLEEIHKHIPRNFHVSGFRFRSE